MPAALPAAAPDASEPSEEAEPVRYPYATHAEAAAYIEELLDELADMAEAAGHKGLSHSILIAALHAAGIAARAGHKLS